MRFTFYMKTESFTSVDVLLGRWILMKNCDADKWLKNAKLDLLSMEK